MRQRINAIQNSRIAQIADGRKYQNQVNRLASALNRLQRRSPRTLLTPQEQALMDKQQHDTYGDLTTVEQHKLKVEVDMMWGQIPEHLQEKAQRLAGLRA